MFDHLLDVFTDMNVMIVEMRISYHHPILLYKEIRIVIIFLICLNFLTLGLTWRDFMKWFVRLGMMFNLAIMIIS